MAAINCDDQCLLTLDQTQIVEIYDLLNEKVRADLQADYDCKKINGATFADTWAKMMSPAIGHIMSAMVTLSTKETAADRAVKASQVDLNEANVIRLQCSCTNETTKTASQVALDKANITRLQCACANETASTLSKSSLNTAQEVKLVCDCTNSSALRVADVALKGEQGKLYERQAKGFDDSANQKLFDSQLSAWSMVFADTDQEIVTSPLQDAQICESYTRIRNNLKNPSAGIACQQIYVAPDSGTCDDEVTPCTG